MWKQVLLRRDSVNQQRADSEKNRFSVKTDEWMQLRESIWERETNENRTLIKPGFSLSEEIISELFYLCHFSKRRLCFSFFSQLFHRLVSLKNKWSRSETLSSCQTLSSVSLHNLVFTPDCQFSANFSAFSNFWERIKKNAGDVRHQDKENPFLLVQNIKMQKLALLITIIKS